MDTINRFRTIVSFLGAVASAAATQIQGLKTENDQLKVALNQSQARVAELEAKLAEQANPVITDSELSDRIGDLGIAAAVLNSALPSPVPPLPPAPPLDTVVA